MELFEIKNELLKQAMWGGHWCKNGYLQRTNGYFNSDVQAKGRAFIEFCVKKIYNIQRFPGFEPYYLKGPIYELQKEFGNLREEDILEACEELKKYITFLQEQLKCSKYNNLGKVKLVRSLRSYEINKATPQLLDECELIKIPVNIINSYAHDMRLFDYGSSMSIIREVDIEKIILWEETLVGPGGKCEHPYFGSEHEVWVMEDNLFGEIEIDATCFKYIELNENCGDRRIRYDFLEDKPLFVPECAPKPCEWNKFTKWIIKRNISEIKKIYHGRIE